MKKLLLSLVIFFFLGNFQIVMAKTESLRIRLLSWNIQVGYDNGILSNNWSNRKKKIVKTIRKHSPDFFCIQEGSPDQIKYLRSNFQNYSMVGVGRDNGRDKGEHCAIFYLPGKFKSLGSDTFWFSDTPSKPGNSWDGIYQRICTWVKLRDKETNKDFCIFNCHFPLNPLVQKKSAKLMLKKQKEISGNGNVFLIGDFNCGPKSSARKLLGESGFYSSANSLLKKSEKTFHIKGLGVLSLDGIYASKNICFSSYEVLDQNSDRASDHYALVVEAIMDKQTD